MAYQLDHVVIGVSDLAAASADFARLGFTVTPGGEHSAGNTHNALISFADGAYLKLIAFKDGVVNVEHKWGARLAQGEGYLDFCLTGPALGPEAARLAAAGLRHDGLHPLGRFRPDGERLEWQSLVPTAVAIPLPFPIEDLTPRPLRVPDGAATEHAVLAHGIAGVRLLVASLPAATAAFAILLGLLPTTVDSSVKGAAAAHRFTLGPQWIEVIEPAPEATDLLAYQQERGLAPYEIVVRSDRPAGLLAPGPTHQARIRLG